MNRGFLRGPSTPNASTLDVRVDLLEAAPLTFTRSTDLTAVELIDTEVLEGTFVATKTTHAFDVSISGRVSGPADAMFEMFIGQPATPGTSLYNMRYETQLDSTKYDVGGIQWDSLSGGCSTRIVKTGLTIGRTVTFQIVLSIIGGASRYKSIDGPNAIAITPDGKKMFVGKYNSASVQPWALNPIGHNFILGYGFNEQPSQSINVGAGPQGIAVTNAIGVACAFTGNFVTVFDVVTETFVRQTAFTNPFFLALKADGTTAYITSLVGTVTPFTVSTGALGSALAVGAGSDFIYGVALNAAETKLFAANYTANAVRVVTLPSTLGATIGTTGKPIAIRRAPVTGKIWVLTEAGGTGGVAMLKSIDPATDTVTATIDLPFANANTFAIMSGGSSAFVGYDAGKYSQVFLEGQFAGLNQTIHQGNLSYEDAAGASQTYTGPVNGIATDAHDSIYYSMFDVDQIFKHPGAKIEILQSSALVAHYCRVVVQ
jgi:hypothetical protein